MKKQVYLYLIIAMVLSSGITYYFCKKQHPVSQSVEVLNDSISKLNENLSNYKRLFEVTNAYFKKDTHNFEFDESLVHSPDSLIRTTLSNLEFYKNSVTIHSPKKEYLVRVDTLLKVEKDEYTLEELNRAKEELENTKIRLDEIQKARGILNLVSSKGKKFQYIGQTKSGAAEGYGVGVFETGSIYKGYWKNNLRHGKGIFTWKDEEFYEGDFVDDKRNGYGEYHWKNGEVYKGFWKNDQRHGEGKLYKKNGKLKKEGIWENDELK